MNSEIIQDIWQICIIPILGILTAFIVKFLKIKSEEIVGKVDNDIAEKYIYLITDTITNCVIATNQTYVESLKKQGKFDAEAQKEAFQMTLNAVLAVLSDEAKEYLTAIYGDLNAYITNQIEATVNQNKLTIV